MKLGRFPVWAAIACLMTMNLEPATAASVEKRIAVAPGVQLRVIEAGKRQNRPEIVFIPGWGAGADIWTDQIERFARAHHVISFDPRSQGQSTIALAGNTPEQRGADLDALLHRERVHRPLLVAWSQGVQDVAAYVLRYGTRHLSAIVLVDAAVSDGASGIAERPNDAVSQFQLFSLYLGNQRRYLEAMFAEIIGSPQPPGVVDRAIEIAMRTPPSIGMAMLVADMFSLDRRAALGKMNCPVLIIASAKSDELDRERAEAGLIKGARFVEIDHAAHAVFLDQPDRFAAELTAFLRLAR